MPKFPDIGTGENMSSQLDRAAQYMNEVFEVKVRAREDDSYQKRCIAPPLGCGEKIFLVEGPHAVTHGHLYTRAGVSEWSLSQLCEYCFDQIMKDSAPDEEELTPEELAQYEKDLDTQLHMAEEVNGGLNFGPVTDPYEE